MKSKTITSIVLIFIYTLFTLLVRKSKSGFIKTKMKANFKIGTFSYKTENIKINNAEVLILQKFKDFKNKKKIILVGDSMLQQYYERFLHNKRKIDFLPIDFTVGGCFFAHRNSKVALCNSNLKKLYNFVNQYSVDKIIIGMGNFYFDDTLAYTGNVDISGIYNDVEFFFKNFYNKKIYFILPVNYPIFNFYRTLDMSNLMIKHKPIFFIDKNKFSVKNLPRWIKLINIAKKYHVKIIDPADYFCKGGICNLVVDNFVLLYDERHTSSEVVKNHAIFIDEILKS